MIDRRKFLGQTLASASGIALSTSAFSNIIVPSQNKKLGVALVGLGYYSTDVLAPALQMTDHCELRGIVTGTPAKAEVWQQKYSISDRNIYNYDTIGEVANNPDIDVLYVVLPPSMHAEYSIKAAEAGKHIWCEKPMAMTVDECQNMIDAADKNNVKLSIGYRLQHEPNTQQLIQLTKTKAYGKVQTVDVKAGYQENRTNHWKQQKAMGGGVMYDMGVYPLNAARYATQMEPIAVTARASTNRPKIYHEVEEIMEFDLEFPGGTTADCIASFGKSLNSLMVDCSNGWYKLEPFQGYRGVKGVTSDGKLLNDTIPNQQAKQMDDDALAIINDQPMLVPGEEGLKDIRVVEAVYRSVAKNDKVMI